MQYELDHESSTKQSRVSLFVRFPFANLFATHHHHHHHPRLSGTDSQPSLAALQSGGIAGADPHPGQQRCDRGAIERPPSRRVGEWPGVVRHDSEQRTATDETRPGEKNTTRMLSI